MKFNLAAEINENPDDRSVTVELRFHEGNETRLHSYLLKFDSLREWQLFSTRRRSLSSSTGMPNRPHEDPSNKTNTTGTMNSKVTTHPSSSEQSRIYLAEFSKLIIYCQGVKLRELNVNKPQDLLGKLIFNIISRRFFIIYLSNYTL